uniref:Uncharacterized protein n=1 Tax=Vitis vinifera TaxID=29760 RepID=A5AEF5_VITVI|nr:hypothetical protein VITISV_015685 [Vitis vinifera]
MPPSTRALVSEQGRDTSIEEFLSGNVSLRAFAICSTTTSAAIHLPGGSFNGYNFALGWNFVSDGGASLFSGGTLNGVSPAGRAKVFRLAMVLRPLQSYSAHRFRMSSRGGVASTNAASKGKKGVQPRENVRRTDAEKSIELLTEWEFKERFRIPYGVVISLMGGDLVSTEKEPFYIIVFINEQFNVGLRFPLPSFFKQFLHFTKIPAAFLHPNARRDLPFYEEARAVDAKARQDRLDKKEKIHQKGTLRQAPSKGLLQPLRVATLLNKVPCFIVLEPPALGLDALFSLTDRHFVNLPGDPPITVMSRLPHGTSESVLRCIDPM